MHELSITESVVRTVAEAAGGRRVRVVRMRVGALSGVVPHALEFAWDVATTGTALAGAALEITAVPVAIACGPCAATSDLDEPLPLRCPGCGSREVELVAGREVEIVNADLDDAPTAAATGAATEAAA